MYHYIATCSFSCIFFSDMHMYIISAIAMISLSVHALNCCKRKCLISSYGYTVLQHEDYCKETDSRETKPQHQREHQRTVALVRLR